MSGRSGRGDLETVGAGREASSLGVCAIPDPRKRQNEPILAPGDRRSIAAKTNPFFVSGPGTSSERKRTQSNSKTPWHRRAEPKQQRHKNSQDHDLRPIYHDGRVGFCLATFLGRSWKLCETAFKLHQTLRVETAFGHCSDRDRERWIRENDKTNPFCLGSLVTPSRVKTKPTSGVWLGMSSGPDRSRGGLRRNLRPWPRESASGRAYRVLINSDKIRVLIDRKCPPDRPHHVRLIVPCMIRNDPFDPSRSMARTAAVVFGVSLSALVAASVGAWFVLRPSKLATIPAPEVREVPTAPAQAADRDVPTGVRIEFADVAESAGVRFHHFDGRVATQYLMDTTAPGLAWLDYDGDGLMDLFLVQGSNIKGPPPIPQPTSKLFRNEGSGRFRDVTDALGVAPVGCGQGAAVGDIDNDGDPDLFVTYYGRPNALFRNEAGQRFVDITTEAGLAAPPVGRTGPNWATSAAFLDHDGDGFLDLFVCNYVEVDLEHYPVCKPFCSPHEFKASACSLYKNQGNGTFADVSHEAGVDQPEAKALGVVALDLDDDGRTDLFVANDEMPNFLFRNLGNGRFESQGLIGGCAVNASGSTQAYMGVDADDLDADGLPDLYATAYARETDTLFRNEGGGQFLDVTQWSGLGGPSWYGLGFGTCFLDPDADGFLDIFVANGHVDSEVDALGDPNNTFRQKAQFYRNNGRGRFGEISRQIGPYFQLPRVGRGVGACDFDNDGRMDLAVANSGEPTALLHNISTTPNHWVRVELRGSKSNRDAVGAKVTLHLADGRRIVRHRKGGGSYLSASDPRLLVGIGAANRVEAVEVRWPSGVKERFGPIEGGQSRLVVEGSGQVEQQPEKPVGPP